MASFSPLKKSTMALAVCMALVCPSSCALVGGGSQYQGLSGPSSDPCVDQSGNPITTGFCNRPLVISLAVVLSSLFVITLAIVAWLKFRRKQTDTKMMVELGIDAKLSPCRDSRETVKIVKVKLPGLSVSIPAGKVAGEMPRSPDSIITPIPFHVGQ